MAFYDPYTAMIGNGHMMGGMLGAYPGMAVSASVIVSLTELMPSD